MPLQQLRHAGKVLFGYDHRHLIHPAVREERLQRRPVFAHEGVLDRRVDQQIIRLHARLPGVQDLAEGDAPRGELQIGRFVDDDGALAAKLQRDGGQVLRRGLHHDLADGDAAGKEDRVEPLGEQRTVLRAAALDGGDVARVKGLADELRDRCARGRGVGRGLDNGAVAAGDRADQRRQAQLHGVIPRRDDQRHAVGLGRNEALCRELRQRRRHRPLAHPALQVLQMEAQLLEHHAGLAHVDLHRRLAEVLHHRLLEQLLVVPTSSVSYSNSFLSCARRKAYGRVAPVSKYVRCTWTSS